MLTTSKNSHLPNLQASKQKNDDYIMTWEIKNNQIEILESIKISEMNFFLTGINDTTFNKLRYKNCPK